MEGVNWVGLLQTFGLAVVILFAIGIAFWRTAKWTAREIIIPLRDKIIARLTEFLQKIEETVAKVDVNVDTITENLKEQTKSLQTIVSETNKTTEAVKDKNDAIMEIGSNATEGRAQILVKIEELKTLATQILAKIEALAARG